MINQQVLRGNWTKIKGILRTKWGSITDDDLSTFNGNVEQLVGTIQAKTGEARERVEHFFEQLTSAGSDAFSQAVDSVRGRSLGAATAVRQGFGEVEEVVRQRPVQSLAICFGAGVIAGVAATLHLRGR